MCDMLAPALWVFCAAVAATPSGGLLMGKAPKNYSLPRVERDGVTCKAGISSLLSAVGTFT